MIQMNGTKLIVSHAPFWHDGDSLFKMNLNYVLALLPAAIFGVTQFGGLALGVIALSVSTAMLWEAVINLASRRKNPIGDLDAAVIGLLFALMVPATMPWWVVVVGTFIAVVIGKFIFGGIGATPFHPTLLAMAVLMMSWPVYFDFDAAYVAYEFNHTALAPLAALKFQGISATGLFSLGDLFMGQEVGGIGSTFGIGIIFGGIYLMLRGYTRWEIVVSFLAGILITGGLFYLGNSQAYASPLFHLFSGYTLLGAFFLATASSSSPVNLIPMFIYGFLGGFMIILMRNIGAYADGTVLAVLLINLVNPLVDNIRPKAIGKGVPHA